MPELKIIARVRSPYGEKFGIPRQSGLAPDVQSDIVFEKEYSDPAAVRGLEDFSHVWLIWGFSANEDGKWSPTVRPPRLGGNTRMGVFATRSPFRPNPLGLSCVRLRGIEQTPDGIVLHVLGADLMDGTPIYDIKPYIPYADCHPDAAGGFTDSTEFKKLRVTFAPELRNKISRELIEVLENDPRPRYHDDPERVYGMRYGGRNVKFRVAGDTLIIVSVD